MSDEKREDILRRLQANDRDAFRELFEDYYLQVCSYMYRYIRDRSTVKDLAQDVFLRFWDKRHQIEVHSSLGAYLRRMAINEALGYLRKNKRWSEEEPDHSSGGSTHNEAEARLALRNLQQQVREAIAELPLRCRTVFLLSRYEELTYAEIAEQMDISVKTVENQMGKALKHLRVRLRSHL
ncbi:MAG: RNA polymerase sigma-70 factor [Saprospiraceae bacterium]|nr:RNA polymerase sigma-70 factor [Saprospiraceae bacterium]